MKSLNDLYKEWAINPNKQDYSPYEIFYAGHESRQAEIDCLNEQVRYMAERIVGSSPNDGDPTICWFCDMGDAGYSSKGPNNHDDGCLFHYAQQALEKLSALRAEASKEDGK